MTLEIVAQSSDDALAAERAGADRIELVSALALGGLTPSIGLLEATRAQCRIPIAAMLRPRSGGFVYSEGEISEMERDAERFLAAGASALVVGVLEPSGGLNVTANRRFARLGRTVFHRAFDLLEDPFDALERVIDLGFERILTSGGQPTALEGATTLRRLVERADGRIEILAGGGIRPANVDEVVSRTGVRQVHLAALQWVENRSPQGLAFNGPAHPEDRYSCVDARIVQAIRSRFPP